MSIDIPAILLLLGLIAGGGFGWFIQRGEIKNAYTRGFNESGNDRATLVERLTGRDEIIASYTGTIKDLEGRLASSNEKNASLASSLANERQQAAEKLAVLTTSQHTFIDTFKALAADSLNQNNESFLKLAQAEFQKLQIAATSDLEKRQIVIDGMINPVKEALGKVDAKLQSLDTAREGAYQVLLEQVRSLGETQTQLRSETSQLVRALRNPVVRGRWGEIQLKRVVELAGMLEHCDFVA